LVGAGPGDIDLVTRKAWETVQSADVLVHDRLIPLELVDAAPAGCEIVDAGKAANDHKLTQDQTNALIVDRALKGLTVVRLKGGDPFTFGRGGEEALACKNAGVTFTVVPGVTSGISVPALAGIPVTHRSVSNSVTLVTASAGPDGSRDPNYAWLAAADGTVVLYMGLRRVGHVAEQLIASGAPADRPIAVISQGATTRQKTVTGTLATIGERISGVDLPSPGLIVVGDVVSLRADLSWFETLPLFGRRVVVTRVRAQASELRDSLSVLGADVIEAPSISIEPVMPVGLQSILAEGDRARYDDVIFTSKNGVSHLWDELRRAGKDARWFSEARVCAIGAATTTALQDRGIHPDVIAASGKRTAVGMAQTLLELPEPLGGRSVAVIRAEVGDERLPAMLSDSGADVDVIPVYRTSGANLSDQAAAQIPRAELVTFASAATVTAYVDACEELSVTGPQLCVSIGPTTTKAAVAAGFDVVAEASEPSVAGLVEAARLWAARDIVTAGGVA
jgi:uroporphyrinogen III methyltransferase/synthase